MAITSDDDAATGAALSCDEGGGVSGEDQAPDVSGISSPSMTRRRDELYLTGRYAGPERTAAAEERFRALLLREIRRRNADPTTRLPCSEPEARRVIDFNLAILRHARRGRGIVCLAVGALMLALFLPAALSPGSGFWPNGLIPTAIGAYAVYRGIALLRS